MINKVMCQSCKIDECMYEHDSMAILFLIDKKSRYYIYHL